MGVQALKAQREVVVLREVKVHLDLQDQEATLGHQLIKCHISN